MGRSGTAPRPRPVGRPKDGDSALTRTTIVAAALNLFAERGFDGTSLSAIADGAGVTSATLYHHFKGKEGVYHATRAHVSKRIVEEFERSVDDRRDLHGNLAALIEASIRLVRSDENLGRFAAAVPVEQLRHPEMFPADDVEPVAAFVADMVRRGIATGAVDPSVVPARVAMVVGVVLAGLATASAVQPAQYGPMARDVMRFLAEGQLPTRRRSDRVRTPLRAR